MGSSYAVRGKPDPKKTRARAAAGNEGSGTASGELQPVEQQEMAGNEATRQMIEKQKSEETPEKSKAEGGEKAGGKLPASVRAQLLSDYTISKMAAAVFAEVQDAKGKTEEITALAVAVWNQSEAVRTSPEERAYFKANNLDQLFENELMFENYGFDRHQDFHEAVTFGTDLESPERLQTALAVVEAVTQVTESGNPMPQEYVVFSRNGLCPTPERADEKSRIQYGALTFWAFDPAKSASVIAQENTKEDTTTTLANATAAEPPPV